MKSETTRRVFLKQGAASAASLAVLTGCTPDTPRRSNPTGLDHALLRSLAEVVLPSELGADGRDRATSAFTRWADGYTPVPELMHGYGSQEIRYGPGDPKPRWASQLAALDLEAAKRWGEGFAELDVHRRRDLALRHLGATDLRRISSPVAVEHVGAALLAWWLATPDATNLCYRRTINPTVCRPLGASGEEPAPAAGGEG
jgi:hypothetical protein